MTTTIFFTMIRWHLKASHSAYIEDGVDTPLYKAMAFFHVLLEKDYIPYWKTHKPIDRSQLSVYVENTYEFQGKTQAMKLSSKDDICTMFMDELNWSVFDGYTKGRLSLVEALARIKLQLLRSDLNDRVSILTSNQERKSISNICENRYIYGKLSQDRVWFIGLVSSVYKDLRVKEIAANKAAL